MYVYIYIHVYIIYILYIWLKMHEISNFKIFPSLKQFFGDVTSLRVFIVSVLANLCNRLSTTL